MESSLWSPPRVSVAPFIQRQYSLTARLLFNTELDPLTKTVEFQLAMLRNTSAMPQELLKLETERSTQNYSFWWLFLESTLSLLSGVNRKLQRLISPVSLLYYFHWLQNSYNFMLRSQPSSVSLWQTNIANEKEEGCLVIGSHTKVTSKNKKRNILQHVFWDTNNCQRVK